MITRSKKYFAYLSLHLKIYHINAASILDMAIKRVLKCYMREISTIQHDLPGGHFRK